MLAPRRAACDEAPVIVFINLIYCSLSFAAFCSSHLFIIRRAYTFASSRDPTIRFDVISSPSGWIDSRILPTLNPGADCVSYPPVPHQIKLCAKLKYAQAAAISG
jgi:hypothetical protein